MRLQPTDIDTLVVWVSESGERVDIDTLVRVAASVVLEREAEVKAYAPGASYSPGDRIWYQGRVAQVAEVLRRGNAHQGAFDVLHLAFDAGETCRSVAGIQGAPRPGPWPDNAGKALESFVEEHAAELRLELLQEPRLAAFLLDPSADYAATLSLPPAVAPPVRAPSLFQEESLSTITRPGRSSDTDPVAWGIAGPTTSDTADGRATYEAIRRALDVPAGGLTREQTWTRCVAPVLEALGWIAAPLADLDEHALFADAASRDRAIARARQGIPIEKSAPAILLAEGWGVPLDRQVAPDGPASAALRLAGRLLSDRVAWGILTNGCEWRLYSSAWGDPDLASTLTTFHSVDLLGIVRPSYAQGSTEGQRTQFRSWLAAFGPRASTRNAYGRSILDEVKRDSAAYAREVVQTLRRRLLESVIPEVAGGFVRYRASRQGRPSETDETLEEIVRASLGLVSRLLLVLFAEHHDLLPMCNPEYRGQSLTSAMRRMCDAVREGPLPSNSAYVTPQYDALMTFFRLLDHGHPQYDLAGATGGPFSSVDPVVSFLERHRLSDRVVARMLAALEEFESRPVDYGILNVRHLCAVAEGLAESLLWVVEPTAGQAALVSNRGTPQAPSSISVPDFVGVSVTEAAVKSVLVDRAGRFGAAMDRIASLRRQMTGAPGETAALAAAEQAALDALLGIKVLDPAMGTGTFLVAAVDTLVDGIVEALAAYHRTHPWVPWAWDPVAQLIVEQRAAIVENASAQGVSVELDRLPDDVILSRLVIERSVYGVDLNQTAVALSRANIAMRAFAVGAPFVDVAHHIRRGDALSGVRLAAVRDEAIAPTLVSGLLASSGPSDVDNARSDVHPYEALLDLWMSEDLGNSGARDVLRRLGTSVTPALQGTQVLTPHEMAAIGRAHEIGQSLGLLHWDVAFPEVFLVPADGDTVQPGFDVIIGSPPSAPPGADGDPFAARARELVRRPGGRVALVVTPANRSLESERG